MRVKQSGYPSRGSTGYTWNNIKKDVLILSNHDRTAKRIAEKVIIDPIKVTR